MRPENVPKNKRSEIPHIFVPGKRLHSLLLYSIDEKMLYTRSARYKSLYYYRCKSRPCSCRVYCDQNEKCFKVRENHQHNHPDHEEEYKINIIQHKIKERCMQSSGGSVKKIFDETVMQWVNIYQFEYVSFYISISINNDVFVVVPEGNMMWVWISLEWNEIYVACKRYFIK